MNASLQNKFIDYNLFTDKLNNLPEASKIAINTINQYSFCVAERDPEFKKALQESDVLLPDGIGIVVGLKSITGQSIKKISGADMHQYLLSKLNQEGGKCFYLGSSDGTLAKIKERIAKEYPNVICECYSPAFKSTFSDEDNDQMIDKINSFKPDVLFVGMTAPKQEKWSHQQKSKLDAKIICSIGAVFDFYAGTVKRPSDFWVNMGLEWFVRLCKEPKRMWKRYVYYGPVFVYALTKEKLKAFSPSYHLHTGNY